MKKQRGSFEKFIVKKETSNITMPFENSIKYSIESILDGENYIKKKETIVIINLECITQEVSDRNTNANTLDNI